jgi:hypothetical protein
MNPTAATAATDRTIPIASSNTSLTLRNCPHIRMSFSQHSDRHRPLAGRTPVARPRPRNQAALTGRYARNQSTVNRFG